MKMPSDAPASVLERLRFQSEAAEIQLGMTEVVRQVFGFLLSAHITPIETRHRAAGDLVRQFRALKDRWHDLRPPDQLKGVWQDLDDGFGDLGALVATIPAFAMRPQPELRPEAVSMQKRFSKQLHALNALEAKLLEEEERLRRLSQVGTDRPGPVAGEGRTPAEG